MNNKKLRFKDGIGMLKTIKYNAREDGAMNDVSTVGQTLTRKKDVFMQGRFDFLELKDKTGMLKM